MRKLLMSAVTAALMSVVAIAHANPIASGSTISINGTDSFSVASFSAVSFTGPGNLGGGTGDFSGLGSCSGCVALNNFDSTSVNFTLIVCPTMGSQLT
jgi:hypothetical protein